MFENQGSPFRKLVAGVNAQVPIKNGVMTPYINSLHFCGEQNN